ncbi:hypothetical protein DFJ43DRAFT_1105779 [Lentinula guzmanii]|uniref:Uncharacterized protein n=1 Tax=Lentinula guzmanii TaxID=2804957 RepID=A0AA38J748_9AGAR|nr:hypothetical protein DFJ43DRAFT_1105779 [Lentinula guzmanii]
MASDSSISLNSHVFVLEPPHCGYKHAELRTVLHNKVMLYDNAPHGYYITQDRQGNQYLFSFASGEDATKAFQEALVARDIPKKRSSDDTVQFNPLPMRTGERPHSSSNNSSAFSYLSRMQSSRMAMPENTTNINPQRLSGYRYIQDSDINSLLPLQGTSIGSNLPAGGQEVFYYLKADVNDTTPGLNELEFKLPIDTGDIHSWLFLQALEYIKNVTVSQKDEMVAHTSAQWPENCNPKAIGVTWPFMVKRPNKVNQMPQKVIKYGSQGYVVINDGPVESKIVVTLHGWDWEKQDRSKDGFSIQDGFDFVSAANEHIIRDGYDGNIGLGPRQGYLQLGTSRSFLAALSVNRQINNASIFIIRLVHPHDLSRAPLNCDLLNILSFGPSFPLRAPVNPDAHFSLPIPTVNIYNDNSARPTSWDVKLLRIGIGPADRDECIWINMDDPNNENQSIKGINILMDTGTPMTILPTYVVSRMLADKHWLDASEKTVGLRKLIMSHKRYRELPYEKMIFEFQGEMHKPVKVVVPAQPFLTWHTQAAFGDDPTSHLCPIKGSDRSGRFVLGQNWYWAAIVKHVSPNERQKFPFVQVMANGHFFDHVTGKPVIPTDMTLKSLPPRLDH